MANIVNPTNIIQFDIVYYILILSLGPGLLWHLLVFRPRQKKIHDAFRNSGVQTMGLVTHRKVTVVRGSLSRRELSRTFEMRYAYKAPGTNVVYIKNFVTVKKRDLQRRLFAVVVLPGQDSSGVPKFLVVDYKMHPVLCFFLYLVAVSGLVLTVYVFSFLFAMGVTDHCTTIGNTRYCVLTPTDGILALVSVLAIGICLAWVIHRDRIAKVPGRVWKIAQCSQNNQNPPPQHSYDFDRLDDQPIPMAEAVAILEDETLQSNTEEVPSAASDSDEHAVVHATPVSEAELVVNNDQEGEKIAEARVMELI